MNCLKVIIDNELEMNSRLHNAEETPEVSDVYRIGIRRYLGIFTTCE